MAAYASPWATPLEGALASEEDLARFAQSSALTYTTLETMRPVVQLLPPRTCCTGLPTSLGYGRPAADCSLRQRGDGWSDRVQLKDQPVRVQVRKHTMDSTRLLTGRRAYPVSRMVLRNPPYAHPSTPPPRKVVPSSIGEQKGNDSPTSRHASRERPAAAAANPRWPVSADAVPNSLVCDYIDYLIEENEHLTSISHAFPVPTPLDFDKEKYFHDAQTSGFPTPKFAGWLENLRMLGKR